MMQRSSEIERIAHQLIEAIEQGDIDTIERMTAHDQDVVGIGSDPSEYARGFDENMRLMRESTPEMGAQIHARLDEVHGYAEGEVGWLDGIGRFERDGESVEVRMTGVLHREDGEWRVVQSHASIGVPNDRMFSMT
jgi:ketosteroid isomerase-like protein